MLIVEALCGLGLAGWVLGMVAGAYWLARGQDGNDLEGGH